jgi:DNA-binding LytR/AlgR family response regulator
MQHSFSCIVADDDEVDRLTTIHFIKKYTSLQIAGDFETATEALSVIRDNKPDVLFLDIDMPEMTGFELRERFLEIPACIFITAHPEYALESFELAALDFIVKPLKADRFIKTAERLNLYLNTQYKAQLLDFTLGSDSFFIKDGHNQVKIRFADILYLEALKDYTAIVTTQKQYCVLSGIGSLLQEKAFQSFIRVHRSFAVQKHFIEKITSQSVIIHNTAIPVGRSYKGVVEELAKNI